jgi:hypothetical protein
MNLANQKACAIESEQRKGRGGERRDGKGERMGEKHTMKGRN